MTKLHDLSNLLSPLNREVLKEFLHRCADEICGRRGPSIEKFCSSCSWSPSQLKAAVSGTKELLIESVVENYDSTRISEKLALKEDEITALMNCISIRGDELQQVLLSNFHDGSEDILCDHDWKLKMIMGSSSLSSLRETLLELDLVTKKSHETTSKHFPIKDTIRVELTLDNVNSLVSSLEKVLASV